MSANEVLTGNAEAVRRRNMRLALVLFAVYLAMYVGFMALAAFAPHRMSEKVAGGVNLAIAYGMGLIVAALVLALVYAVACKREAPGEAERPNS